MLAFAICSIAIIYLYVSPIIRCKCRKNNQPVSAELVDEYKDL
jgi:hypothetical protein